MSNEPTRTPITELQIEVSPKYADGAARWLEGFGCTVGVIRDGCYLVHFPPGTVEQEQDSSGGYVKHSTIVLPNGKELRKIVVPPLTPTQATRTTLRFPTEVYP